MRFVELVSTREVASLRSLQATKFVGKTEAGTEVVVWIGGYEFKNDKDRKRFLDEVWLTRRRDQGGSATPVSPPADLIPACDESLKTNPEPVKARRTRKCN